MKIRYDFVEIQNTNYMSNFHPFCQFLFQISYKSISTRTAICHMLAYFTIKAQETCFIWASYCEFFCNTTTIPLYMYDGTVAGLYKFFTNLFSLLHQLSPTLSLRLPHFSLSFLWFSLCSSVALVLTRVSKIGVVVRWVVRLRLAMIGKKCIDHFGILIN